MTLEAILTGTGTPVPEPGRAGPGVFIRTTDGTTRLQVDAGRGTVERLSQVGIDPGCLDAVLVTHDHSDHLIGLADLVISRWIGLSDEPLRVICPTGPAADILTNLLEPWADEFEGRRVHGGRATVPAIHLETFTPRSTPQTLGRVGGCHLVAVGVHHEPVEGAVAYRVNYHDDAIVVSGDTRVCDEVQNLATGADVLIHEALRTDPLQGTPFAFVVDYHADTRQLGALAQAAGVHTLALTHLIPPPTPEEEQLFTDDIRAGGYQGRIIVGRELNRIRTGGAATERSPTD